MPEKKAKFKVLIDHKKIGKNFVPPYVYLLGEGNDMQWRQRIIPEYLWLGLLNFKLGWVDGADISLTLARTASQAVGISIDEFNKQFGQAPKQFFGLTSSYTSLSNEQKQEIIVSLKEQSKLEILQEGIVNLISLYPECPLNFLFSELPQRSEEDLSMMVALVEVLFDVDHKLTVSALTNAIYIAFCTNKMKVVVSDDRSSPTDSSLAHFPEIENYPNTELSKTVAAGVRLSAGLLLHSDEKISTEWCDYFWNRGLEISACRRPSTDTFLMENI